MDPTIRLRIATRIHFALLRHYGEDVAVSSLLKGEGEAREALWVCEASGQEELVGLARQFTAVARQTSAAVAAPAHRLSAPAARGAVPQSMAWAEDTTGFGPTRPLEYVEAASPKSDSWLRPGRWLRR